MCILPSLHFVKLTQQFASLLMFNLSLSAVRVVWFLMSYGKNCSQESKENQKKYPILAMLAKDVLGVPSSSAPVERLFSIAGKVFTPERCQLTDKRFEQLMFIRCNHAHTSQ